jgi:sugar phosphate isomerase/epimerase
MYGRREFLKLTAAAAAGFPATGSALKALALPLAKANLFDISLAEWSVNRAIFGGKLDHLDFARFTRGLGIGAVEYVNQFFMDRAKDMEYLAEMKKRAADADVLSLTIMCDSEGAVGHPDEKERLQAVDNHKKWVEAAKYLGCHSVRINGYHPGVEEYDEAMKLVADGLRGLCEFADGHDVNVLIENHGGLSSNGKWLAGVMDAADHPRAGTMPDFGNFRISREQTYDSYRGVAELMPYAKAVSVKPNVWDDNGNQSPLDYVRMTRIVLDAGYRGYFGIEYGREGEEAEAIREVKNGLEKARAELQEEYES